MIGTSPQKNLKKGVDSFYGMVYYNNAIRVRYMLQPQTGRELVWGFVVVERRFHVVLEWGGAAFSASGAAFRAARLFPPGGERRILG